MSNIILITHWTSGDVFPFLRFGKLLKQEGHRVTVLTHCIFEERAKAMGLEFVPVDTPEEYADINRDMLMLSDPIGNKEDYLNFHLKYHGKDRLLREVDLIENLCTDDTIIIARFRSSIAGQIAAERKKLPYASMILAPNYFSHMELHEQMFGKDFCDEINEAREVLQMPAISNWKDWLYSPKLILGVWPDWYAEADETWPKGACPIGFLEDFDENEKSLQNAVLDELVAEAHRNNKKFVIVSGGSSHLINEEFYKSAIGACVLSDVYAVIVTPYEEYVPKNLPERIRWIGNVSLRTIMGKADMIIHHGGMGTLNEAIDAGIPQIVLPHFADRPDNADRLVKMGVAAKFPPKQWEPMLIADGINKMFNEATQRICKEYQKKNLATYAAKLWAKSLSQIEPYVLPKQEEAVSEIKEENQNKRELSKKLLLDVLRKRKEMNK